MLETDNYEKFKKDILALAKIDLNSYKEKQMRRRINTLITKNHIATYDEYVALIKKDKEKFEQFINFLTINVSEFYRNPDQWKILENEVFSKLIQKFGKNLKIWSVACSTGDVPFAKRDDCNTEATDSAISFARMSEIYLRQKKCWLKGRACLH